MAHDERGLEAGGRIWKRGLGTGPGRALQERIATTKAGGLQDQTISVLLTLARSFDLHAARHERKHKQFPTDNGSRMAKIAWSIASAELKRAAHELQS